MKETAKLKKIDIPVLVKTENRAPQRQQKIRLKRDHGQVSSRETPRNVCPVRNTL